MKPIAPAVCLLSALPNLAYMAKVTAEVAATLGNTADEAHFKTMFENIRKD